MAAPNILSLNYNEKFDTLYIKIRDCMSSYEDETYEGVSYFRDETSNDLVGLIIWGLKKHYADQSLNQIRMPFKVDFEKDIIPKVLKS